MKAADYFAKYKDLMFNAKDGVDVNLPNGKTVKMPSTVEKMNEIIGDLCGEMIGELNAMITKRKIRSDKALLSAVAELNDRYNKICTLFEQEFGHTPIKRNGFRQLIMTKLQTAADKEDAKHDE